MIYEIHRTTACTNSTLETLEKLSWSLFCTGHDSMGNIIVDKGFWQSIFFII